MSLRVNGKEYGGWKTARATVGIESIAGSFELAVSDRWSAAAPWAILEEDECDLVLDDEPIIKGWVDKRAISYGPEEHTLTVSGRSTTGALVDCSALLDNNGSKKGSKNINAKASKQATSEFANVPLLTLATRLCDPFGIAVKLEPSGLSLPPPAKKLTVEPGDTSFDVLERACRLVGVLPVADGAGGLLLMRPGSLRCGTSLVEGQNIKAASGTFDATARFHRYVVHGQHPGGEQWAVAGEDGKPLRNQTPEALSAEALDMNVRRTERVLLVRAEGALTAEYAKRRVEWELAVRAARADAIEVTVQGWKQQDGTRWPVNALVAVRSPLLGVNGDLMITEATYSLDNSGGTTTRLSLKRPDAFLPEPVITKPGPGAGWAHNK